MRDAGASRGVRIAVEGCGHGTLNAIYAAVDRSCKERGWDGVDALIIGGDFQACRNKRDLNVMSVPVKYREMGDFHEYYSGTRKAPYLTIFVAGNHEASSHLWELYYGGWVAPNIYYMGAANVLRLGPLRIAGMSGIWKGFDYRKPHHERLPFSQSDVKSFYHVREIDVRKLLQLRTQVDIGISHDWPRAIEKHGNQRHLFNMKPDFERESHDGTLGNVAAEYVMDRLRPPYWFSAHLHCKFAAIKTYDQPKETEAEPSAEAQGAPTELAPAPSVAAPAIQPAANPDEIDLDMEDDINTSGPAPVSNPDEISLDLDDEGSGKPPAPSTAPINPVASTPLPTADTTEALRAQLPAAFARPQQRPKVTPGQPTPRGVTNTTVRFLALDKCLPGRKFLQLCEIPTTASPPFKLQYDPEWLAITRVFAPSLIIGDRAAQNPPDQGESHYLPLIQTEEGWVDEHITQPGKLDVPENFELTAPKYDSSVDGQDQEAMTQPEEYTNPQTVAFCELVGVPNLWNASEDERRERKEKWVPEPDFPDFGGRGGRGGGGRGRGRGGRGRGGRGGRGRGRGW
ncbi:lariat debranching enzyme, C-terminal domain-containing protein [Cercophora newfieldiana]|uniref:Lariat debranching enzyme, C-terminal domain-containing protein n=1 Tax=Cercophora newfieldiana TaxID=92897 RepID=A0AA39YFG7_9PEZI|nr:lariat debranching enzyme, C-terminal domain-containing protein [Cercophora newfieldiana]